MYYILFKKFLTQYYNSFLYHAIYKHFKHDIIQVNIRKTNITLQDKQTINKTNE